MSGASIEQLVRDGWAEHVDADDAEVLGLWEHAVESFIDASALRLSRRGQFKNLYDAGRQGVASLLAAHGYRARGTAGHHQRTFAAGVAVAPEAMRTLIASMQVHRSVRHDVEYSAHGEVSDAEVESDAFLRLSSAQRNRG